MNYTKSFSVAIILSLLFSCSSSDTFNDYIEDVGELSLPFYMDTEGKSISKKDFDKELYEKHKVSWGYEPAGYFVFNDSIKGVLEYSFDKVGYKGFLILYNRGVKSDSIVLFENSQIGERSATKESAFIHSDKIEIKAINSTFKRNKQGDILEKGYKTRESKREVFIDEGKFR